MTPFTSFKAYHVNFPNLSEKMAFSFRLVVSNVYHCYKTIHFQTFMNIVKIILIISYSYYNILKVGLDDKYLLPETRAVKL